MNARHLLVTASAILALTLTTPQAQGAGKAKRGGKNQEPTLYEAGTLTLSDGPDDALQGDGAAYIDGEDGATVYVDVDEYELETTGTRPILIDVSDANVLSGDGSAVPAGIYDDVRIRVYQGALNPTGNIPVLGETHSEFPVDVSFTDESYFYVLFWDRDVTTTRTAQDVDGDRVADHWTVNVSRDAEVTVFRYPIRNNGRLGNGEIVAILDGIGFGINSTQLGYKIP